MSADLSSDAVLLVQFNVLIKRIRNIQKKGKFSL